MRRCELAIVGVGKGRGRSKLKRGDWIGPDTPATYREHDPR